MARNCAFTEPVLEEERATADDPGYPLLFDQEVLIDGVKLTNRISCLPGVDETCP